jgi:bifunctional DNA-binding transcriptional regulator/antitoxin component of YhaV-PrlF toxin-antitoxin module
MKTVVARLGKSGRLVVPAEFRHAMGLEDGAQVLLRLDQDGLHITTPQTALGRAQAWVRSFTPEGVSLADELIAERRREAELEP